MQLDRQALLRSVLEFPFDDAPRGALADWLEENPDIIPGLDTEAYANAIRLGMAFSEELRRVTGAAKTEKKQSWDRIFELMNQIKQASGPQSEWLRLSGLTDERGFLSATMDLQTSVEGITDNAIKVGVLDRGFVSKLAFSRLNFHLFATELFSRHPITRVDIQDAVPDVRASSRMFRIGVKWNIRIGVKWNIRFDETDPASMISIKTTSEEEDRKYRILAANNETQLREKLSDYLVDEMRKRNDLPPLFGDKWPEGWESCPDE